MKLSRRAERLVQLFNLASDEDIERGKAWYTKAQHWAECKAKQYGLTLEQTAGIIAALSPLRSWEYNLASAEEVFISHANNEPIPYNHFTVQCEKVELILEGIDPNKLFSVKRSGHKTLNFYHNILDPHNELRVTIDRHMIRILGYDRDALTPRQYIEGIEVFYEASNYLDLRPCELQAILWIVIRDRIDYDPAKEIPF